MQHNYQINWAEGAILLWSLLCHAECLVSAVPTVSSVSVFQENPGDLSGVPEEYHDLQIVFSHSRAAFSLLINLMTVALIFSLAQLCLAGDCIHCLHQSVKRSKNISLTPSPLIP